MGMGSQIGELAGGLIGEVDAMRNDSQIQYLLNMMRKRWEDLPDAERVNFAPTGRSELDDVSEDPRYRNAENDALDQLMALAREGGLSDADKAKLEASKLSALDYERGVRGRDEELMKRRGLANSGALLSSEITAQQGGIDRAYKGDVATAASAADRALAALTAGGSFAERLGSRDLNQKSRAATANDAISRFNASRADAMDMYNSRLDHENAMDRYSGLDKEAGMEIGMNDEWGERTRRKWRGYGKQVGALGDSLDSGGGGGGGGGGIASYFGGGGG